MASVVAYMGSGAVIAPEPYYPESFAQTSTNSRHHVGHGGILERVSKRGMRLPMS